MKAPLCVMLAGMLGVGLIQWLRPQQRLTDRVVFRFNEQFQSYSAETLRAMTFGYGHAAGALLWLRFLQQTPPRKVEEGEVSWIYRDLDALTEIDPDFYPAYEHGGIFLSVITEDKTGAERILLKGAERFPNRWRLRAYLGYHYQFELRNEERAAEQYRIGSALPEAPALLGLIASSFLQKERGREESIRFLEGMVRETTDPAMRKQFEDKLRRLRTGSRR